MNESRKFRVLKDFTLVLGTSIVVRRFKKGEIFDYNHMINIDDLLSDNTIEEILSDKKPISSEEGEKEMLDYDRKYNIHEVFTLLKSMPQFTLVKDNWDYYTPFYYDKYEQTLINFNDRSKKVEHLFRLEELLNMTFTLVKPVEEVKEKWIRIEHGKQLCDCVVKNMMTRVLNQNGDLVYKRDTYDERYIHTLFQYLTDSYSGYAIEYLEEN